jgi:hypothetical protein
MRQMRQYENDGGRWPIKSVIILAGLDFSGFPVSLKLQVKYQYLKN